MKSVVFRMEQPNPRQIEFFESTARRTAYGGAKGGGKSWAMRRNFELLALNHSNLKLLLLRRTLKQLRDNHIENMRRELNGIANYVDSRYAFEFPNGSIIRLGFCDADQDVDNYIGVEYDVIGFEEATLFTEYMLTQIALSARNVRPDFTPRIYYTCNPGGPGHDYIKRLFIDRVYKDNENPDDYVFIPAKVYDNVALLKNNPEYVNDLKNLPEHRRRALLDGDWDVIEGQYFEEFRRVPHEQILPDGTKTIVHPHVCKPFPIPSEWKRFRAMDYGYNDPCCVLWFAVAPDSRTYVYNEIYVTKRLTTNLAFDIRSESRHERISYTVGSPDMWQKRGVRDALGGECVAETLIRSGVPVIPADNSRMNGWNRIRENLATAPDGIPYLQIFENCKNLIRTLPNLTYDEHDHEDVSDKCEDHAAEALRYGLMSRPSPAKIKPEAKKNKYGYDPFDTGKQNNESGFFGL